MVIQTIKIWVIWISRHFMSLFVHQKVREIQISLIMISTYIFIFWKREIDIFHQILSQFIVSHFCKLKQLEIHLCTAFRYYVFYCCKKYDLFNEVNLTKLIFCFHISASWLSNLGSLSDLLHIHREIVRGKKPFLPTHYLCSEILYQKITQLNAKWCLQMQSKGVGKHLA